MVTIAAPYDPGHVTGLFKDHIDTIREQGEVEVKLGGRPFTIKREFLDDVAGKKLDEAIANLRKSLLVFHSPTDDLVGIDNASHIFQAAKHPKSFVSLAGADHLLSKKADAVYVANVIAAAAGRYLDQPEVMTEEEVETGLVLVRETHGGKFQQEILTGPHRMLADEPVKPRRFELRAGALRLSAGGPRRLHLDDDPAVCRVQENPARECLGAAHPTARSTSRIARTATPRSARSTTSSVSSRWKARSTPSQRQKLMEIADKCPVHKTLESKIDIHTVERATPSS